MNLKLIAELAGWEKSDMDSSFYCIPYDIEGTHARGVDNLLRKENKWIAEATARQLLGDDYERKDKYIAWLSIMVGKNIDEEYTVWFSDEVKRHWNLLNATPEDIYTALEEVLKDES